MKKLLIFITVIVCLGCDGPIVGDSYIVTKVEKFEAYKKQYKVEIRCLDRGSGCDRFTTNGNIKTVHTNTLYTVGDTIRIQ